MHLTEFVVGVPWDQLGIALEADACEQSLAEFLRCAWPHFDPSSYVHGWHIDAISEHLEAVSDGQIRKLLINVPPRHAKTSIVAIAWPCWTWAQLPRPGYPLIGPGVRFLCASYGAKKAQEDGVTARRLIGSPWYQKLWGSRFSVAEDRDNQERYDNSAGGSRINTGIPESLGKGGMIRILDDPQKTDEVESDLVRQGVIRAYDEVWSTRSNDPAIGAEVIIMQRLSQDDISGHVLASGDWVHVCLPAEFEEHRRCVTVLGWEDPREEEGEPLWPERFSPEWLASHAERVGPFAWAGQYQQSPNPRGGGIIKAEWWQVWESETFPEFGTVLASLDGALTEQDIKTASYSALTIWGAFADDKGRPNLMLLWAWRGRVGIHELVTTVGLACQGYLPSKTLDDDITRARRGGWPRVDYLLVEDKASGRPAAQEIRRLYGARQWSTRLIQPKGDKIARLRRVEPHFAAEMIWAPDRDWAQMVIDEVSAFPNSAHSDLTDTVSQAVGWCRDNGVVLTRAEHAADVAEALRYRKPQAAVYDV